MSKVISQRTVEAARAPKEGRLTKADGIVPGLQFIVHSGGKKSFRLIARIHGKQVNLEIGDASILSLADARAKAKRLLGQIAEGIDPREARQEAVKVASETVEVVARRFVERHAKAHTRRWEETERQIEREIIPVWGRRPISLHRPRRRRRPDRWHCRSWCAGDGQSGIRHGAEDVLLGVRSWHARVLAL